MKMKIYDSMKTKTLCLNENEDKNLWLDENENKTL